MTEPEIRSAVINGTNIQYLYYPGNGPPLVFMHATGFLPWLWNPIAQKLCGEYSIIAPYFCDHREIHHNSGGLSWLVLAEDLYRLCESLGYNDLYMAGHSMGAVIVTFASWLLKQKKGKIILFEPIFLPENFYGISIKAEQHPLASKSLKRLNFWKEYDQIKSYLRSRKLFRDWDEEMLDIYIKYGFIENDTGGFSLACSPQREASLFMGGLHKNPWDILSEINVPVLIVEGAESDNRKFMNLKKAAEQIPHGKYHLLEDAGHLFPMEMPDETVKIINNFFHGSNC